MGRQTLLALSLLLYLFVSIATAGRLTSAGYLPNLYARSSTTGCSSGLRASVIFELCYNATYDLIRRGVAQDTVMVHVSSVMREIIKFGKELNTTNLDVDTVGSLCVPVEKYSPLFTVRWTTVFTEEELDDMLMTIGNSFYSVSNIDVALPPLNATLEADRTAKWLQFKSQLNVPINQMDYKQLVFPRTALHAYDWKHANACSEWNRFTQYPTSSTAEMGLRKVLKVAVELVIMGVDPSSAWQLVRHYTALVHLGIRCLKLEGPSLMVPNFFDRTYSLAAVKLLSKASKDGTLQRGNAVPGEAFDAVFKFEYERLAQFGSWGQPDAHFGPGVTIKNMLSYTAHATQAQLQFAINFFGNGSQSLPTSVRPAGGARPNCNSAANTNGNMKCQTADHYCYYPASSVSSWYENCCNELICNNVVAILPDYFNSYEACCKTCHQLGCSPSFTEQEDINVPRTSKDETLTVHVYL